MKPNEYKEIRKALALTRPELAERLGCDMSTIKKRETGLVNITDQAATAIEALRAGRPQPNGAGHAAGIAAPGTTWRAHRRTQPVAELTPFPVRNVMIGVGVIAGAIIAVTRWAARSGAA